MITIPPQLAENIRYWHGVDGEHWLAELDGLVPELARRWRLDVGEPFADGGAVSWVAPAGRHDGGDAVLKLYLVDLENAQEPDALAHYDGEGAVRLLEAAPGAMLLERLSPGTLLWELEDDRQACLVAAGLLRRMWKPPAQPHQFRSLAGDAARWAEEIPDVWERAGRPFERSLAELGVRLAGELAGSQGEQVVLHQDLHGGNILRSGDGWLAIDPKPLVGEREFDLASLIRDRRWAISEEIVRSRLELCSAELGLDRERMRGWAIVHALAWGIDDDGADEAMVAVARWLAQGSGFSLTPTVIAN